MNSVPQSAFQKSPIQEPVIRETPCKTILNKCAISDYSLNCYGGCAHACAYCYARFMQRFHAHPEPWGGFIDVKTNAVEALERQVRRLTPGDVFVSSACDAWQPIERERGLTRACCAILLEHGFHVGALTKSALILRDLDIFAGRDATVGVTVTTIDEKLAALWEPHAAPVQERFRVIEEAHAAGIETTIMFGPLLPFLSDKPDHLHALFERAAAARVDQITVDALNPRPKVWESVSALLNRHFPDLRERYANILFSDRVREPYLAALRDRILNAAQRFHLAGRITICF